MGWMTEASDEFARLRDFLKTDMFIRHFAGGSLAIAPWGK
jgi:hypothetical protein